MAFAQPSTTEDILTYVNNSYKNEIFDEFIVPTAFNNYEGLKQMMV